MFTFLKNIPFPLLGILVLSGIHSVAVAQPASEAFADPFVYIYDTETPLAEASKATYPKEFPTGLAISEGIRAHAFKGDSVVLNDKVALVLRTKSLGVDLYTRDATGFVLRSTLKPLGKEGIQGLERIRIEENASDGAVLLAEFSSSQNAPSGLRLELRVGQPIVKVQALGTTTSLHIEAACEYVVLPDFFADDIVVAAADLPVQRAALPSENFLLNLTDDGNALVMNVWDNRAQEVEVSIGQSETGSIIEATEIAFGEGGSVWVAALAEQGIWHHKNIQLADKDKILPLPWKRPYPAVWRVDWRRDDGLTDSWEMALEQPNGMYEKSELFERSQDDWTDSSWWSEDKPRRRWNTGGLGGYYYPCWLDKDGQGWLQPLNKQIVFWGPAIVYPIARNRETPLDKFTVTDIVRTALGVGPCQYILDVEGQDMDFQGRPTCDVRSALNAIYEQGMQGNRQPEIESALDDVLVFIRLIRGRIDKYAAFAKGMRGYLEKEKAGEHEFFVLDMLKLLAHMESGIETRIVEIQTPQYAKSLVDGFRSSVLHYEGPDALQRCKEITSGFVKIGDNQDELVAECRLSVKLLRQHAGLAMATNPDISELVGEIRKQTQAVLRDPVNYEAARH